MTPGESLPSSDRLADQAFAVAASAYAGTPDRWDLAVRAAISALFDFLANRPSEATSCLAPDGPLGAEDLAERDRLIKRFATLLEPGFELAAEPPSPVVTDAVGGGIYEIVRGFGRERRLQELRTAIPDATVVALTPFVGAKVAAEVAGATNMHTDR
jgi:hypothetical protein